MTKFFRVATFIALIFSAKGAFAACHVVTSAGSGLHTGADWNDAYAGLPGTLTRGDIYYLADGTYGAYTFTTAVSGTTVVEIRKAQPSDHCIDTGWDAGTMGSGQAKFSAITVGATGGANTGFLTVNGNGTSTAQGCGPSPATNSAASDCGIYVGPGCNQNCWLVGIDPTNGPSANTNLTFKYLETEGSGTFTNEEDDWICRATCNNVVMDHIYSFNSGCVFFKVTSTNSFTVSNSYFFKNYDTVSGCHGQMWITEGNTSNVRFFNNVIRDIRGTGIWVGVAGSQMSNYSIYSNVIWRANTDGLSNGISNGIIDSINTGSQGTNMLFIGNTVSTLANGSSSGFNFENPGGSLTVENNIWYGSSSVNCCGSGNPTLTENHNSCLSTSCWAFSSRTDVNIPSGGPDPFVSVSSGNFNLSSENSDWASWLVLGPPYNVDPSGTVRTTDRGAYQSSGSLVQAPLRPTGLQVTVQ